MRIDADHENLDSFGGLRIGDTDRGAFQDSRMAGDYLFDLVWIDVEAGDNDHVLLAIHDLGKSVRGLEANKIARRTFAAVAAGDKAAIGVCSDVTLADLSNILAIVVIPDFKIQRALNLDGGSSSAFWFKRASGSAFSIAEQKPVRDFVAVVAK